jgi:membrane associated rhomboid family serine protease
VEAEGLPPPPPFEPYREPPAPPRGPDPHGLWVDARSPDPERVRARLAAPTPVTWALLALMAAAFAGLLALKVAIGGTDWSDGAGLLEPIPARIIASFAPAERDLVQPAQWWRLAAAPFLKSDLLSLALSLLWLRGVGRTAERILGGAGLLAAFFGGAFAGVAAGLQQSTSFPALFALTPALIGAARGEDFPPELARQIRRGFVKGLALTAALMAALVYALRANGVPVAIPWRPWAAGIGAGFLVGLLLHAKVRRPDLMAETRARLVELGLAGGGLALLLLAAPQVLAIARAGAGPEAVESFVRKEPTDRRTIERFGISLDVPKGWMEAELTPVQAKHNAAFHPPEGGAMLHVLVVPKNVFSAFTAPGGDVQLDELRREHPEVVAGNFVHVDVAGKPATRLVARYRMQGREIEEARYIVTGAKNNYTFIFAGAPRFAQMLADSTMKSVEIEER